MRGVSRMTPKSSKAKGRRLAKWLAKELGEIDSSGNYYANVVSLPGSDIADPHKRLPWVYTECRNREEWQTFEALVREMRKKASNDWLVCLGKNRTESVFLMPLNIFQKLFSSWVIKRGIKVDMLAGRGGGDSSKDEVTECRRYGVGSI